MSNHSIAGSQADDDLNGKAKWLMAFVFIALCLLVIRLFYLQVLMGAHYDDLAQNNRLRILTVRPPRGKIVDRNGLTLADNRPAFNVVVVPEDLENRAATVRRLAYLLDRDPEEIDKAIKSGSGKPYEPVAVARDVSFDAMSRVEMELYSLNGVAIEATAERDYVDNGLAAHVLGYLGEVTKAEIDKHPELDYVQGDLVGKSGVEQTFENELKGVKGARVVEVDAKGRKIRIVRDVPPTSGRELRLSIDKRLQAIARTAIADKYGAVVAMDPRTGEVLVMVSTPDYDPNMFLTPIAPESWQQMMEDPLHPMENRALRGQYPPGSIFKAFMCIAALESGTMTPEQEVYCPGKFYLGRHAYRCWQPRGHGRVNMISAMEQSCDVYFYTLGMALGIDTIHDYATRYGFGSRTGIELKPEAAGLVPSQDWKRRRFHKPWMQGETVLTSIGQGYLLTTPLQIATGISAVVNGGHLYQPTLLAGGRPVVKRELHIPEADTQIVREALRAVVEGQHGTARSIRDTMFSIGGKTGTAQVARGMISKRSDASDIPYELRDHAWFVGFAPVENPEIVVVALVEHGGHGGSITAPIVKDVIKGYYFLKGLKDEQLLEKTQ